MFMHVVYQIWYGETSDKQIKAKAQGICVSVICYNSQHTQTLLLKKWDHTGTFHFLHLVQLLKVTNVIMACRVQQTQRYAKYN